jgi:putative glycosyltransferase
MDEVKLSVVTTIYKSSGAIDIFYQKSLAVALAIGADLELIFVNDGSPDDGLRVASDLVRRCPEIVVIDLSRNFGQNRALWTGLQNATGDIVAILDGDLEEDPGWLKMFYNVMHESGCEAVYGVQADPKGNAIYRALRRLFYRLLNTLSADEFPANCTTARLMSRHYVDSLLRYDETEISLLGLMHVVGFSQIGVNVDKVSRSATTFNFKKLTRLFINGLISFSTAPLLFIFVCGVSLCFGAGLFVLYLLIALKTSVPGWLLVLAAITFFSGLIIFFLGIIAIYVGSIFLEVKRRPIAVVRQILRNSKSKLSE